MKKNILVALSALFFCGTSYAGVDELTTCNTELSGLHCGLEAKRTLNAVMASDDELFLHLGMIRAGDHCKWKKSAVTVNQEGVDVKLTKMEFAFKLSDAEEVGALYTYNETTKVCFLDAVEVVR